MFKAHWRFSTPAQYHKKRSQNLVADMDPDYTGSMYAKELQSVNYWNTTAWAIISFIIILQLHRKANNCVHSDVLSEYY